MLILCYILLYSCGLLFSKGTIHNPVTLSLFPFKIFSYFMMWKFLCVKNALHPESHILRCISIQCVLVLLGYDPLLIVLGSWGNANVNDLFDLIFPSFGSNTVIGGFLAIVCSWGSLSLM